MSADLLAEFDDFYKSPTASQSATPAPSNPSPYPNAFADLQPAQSAKPASLAQPTWNTTSGGGGDDIWGDFQSLTIENKKTVPPPSQPQSDPWAQFGAVTAPQKSTPAPASDPWDIFNSPTTSSPHPATQQAPSNGGWSNASIPPPKHGHAEPPKVVRTSTMELFSNNIADLAESESRRTASTLSSSWLPPKAETKKPNNSGGEVLFDASEEMFNEPDGDDDDDEFGDFETATPEPTSTHAPPPSLAPISAAAPTRPLATVPAPLSLQPLSPTATLPTSPSSSKTLVMPNFPYPQAPKSPSFQERNPFGGMSVSTLKKAPAAQEEEAKTESPVTAWPSFAPKKPTLTPYEDSPVSMPGKDDDWGDWADLPPESASVPKKEVQDDWNWDSFDSVPKTTPAATKSDVPPTNVPPPSILLSVFVQLFDLPQSSLFQPVAGQPFSLKNRILSDPSTVTFLRGYIMLATVAAHIIAGRKLRWKRDTILSQSMRIGPAAAGGKGGMKLTGVDKSETLREDREAADVVRAWKEHLGRLRSAVATANASIQNQSEHLAVPEISETMQVKEIQGALKAPKACIICGMKREERVLKVDTNVEDSFGEWWIEHWGHRSCRNFWQEHESTLRQR